MSIKITSVDIISIPPNAKGGQTPVICKINTSEGIYGYGEAGVSIMHFSLGAVELIRNFSKIIIGMNPLDTDYIWERLYQTFWAQGNGGVIMAAISAIDTALWDIKGKYFNVPCYVLLGGKHRDKLRAYASQLQFGWKNESGFSNVPGSVEFLRDATRKAIADGYTAVKVDFINKYEDGRPMSNDILKNHITPDLMKLFVSRVAAVREELGPEGDIIMENHCLTTANTAIQFGRATQQYNIMLLEEPANPLNDLEYKRIADALEIPVATGERNYTRWGFLPLLKNGSLSVAQPDLGNCGGLTEGRKIADLCNSFGVSVQTHTCNTPLSVAAALHMETAIPNFIIHEHHTSNTLKAVTELCVYDYQPVDGYFTVPELPGIGNELSEKALATAEIISVK